MSDEVEALRRSPEIETVLAAMHPDVVWANGLEGGRVYGRDEVWSDWKRQWARSLQQAVNHQRLIATHIDPAVGDQRSHEDHGQSTAIAAG